MYKKVLNISLPVIVGILSCIPVVMFIKSDIGFFIMIGVYIGTASITQFIIEDKFGWSMK